jgi:hypothetical protein
MSLFIVECYPIPWYTPIVTRNAWFRLSLSQLVHQDRRHSQTGIYCEWIKGSSSERPEVTVNTLSLVLCESREVVSACIGKHASQKAG